LSVAGRANGCQDGAMDFMAWGHRRAEHRKRFRLQSLSLRAGSTIGL
jgi:hypothetical protein